MEHVPGLQTELEVARKELKNLRSAIHGLRQKHLRDVSKIREDIQNVNTNPSGRSSAGKGVQDVPPDPASEFQFHFRAIGTISTVFKAKNGTPRQSGVSPTARGVITLLPAEK